MGLTGSRDSSSFQATLGILRSVLGFDLAKNGEINLPDVSSLKTKSLNDVISIKLTKEVSVETVSAEVARRLQNDFEERYNWRVEESKPKGATSADAVVPSRPLVAVVQQTMTKHAKRKCRKVETDVQPKAEKETETLTDSNHTSITTNISPTKREPWFTSQWYQSINGMRYGITIDTNNSDVMSQLENFSNESVLDIQVASESIAELSFSMKTGEIRVLKFNKWDPRTLEVLTKAMVDSTGNPPTLDNKIEAKQIYSFAFMDKLGHKFGCSIDMNNARVLKKLKIMEGWALQLADPYDLFDIKMESADGSVTVFQLDLKNTTTLKNLRALKEESLTGKSAKLINPIRKKEKVQELLVPKLVCETSRNAVGQQPATVELFSPYTGTFTTAFDISDQKVIRKFQIFNDEFRGSLYQYLLTIETASHQTYEIKLDMANPKVVYGLIMITRKYSPDVVSFDPKIILNNLITIRMPEDDLLLTLDISRSIVYGGLFDMSNRERKGVELTIPCKGHLVGLYIDITNPHVVNKIRSFGLATIVPNVTRKISLITLIFLNTNTGFKPISLDLADKKNVMAICKIIRSNPVGQNPAYVEILDDTGQFVTVSLDLNNPKITESLTGISRAAWFVSINAIQSPYFVVCFPHEKRHKTIKVRLKPVIVDEMSTMLDKYCPDYALLEIFDTRRKCSIIYIDPTMPNLIHKLCSITNAVQILQPKEDNAVTIYNQELNTFVDIDLSLETTRKLLLKFEDKYRPSKNLTVFKYHSLDRETYFFVNIDEQFLNEIKTNRADLGQHITLKSDLRKEYVLKITDYSGTSLSLRMDLASNRILKELDKITNSEDFNIKTTDAYGYPIKVKLDTENNVIINKLISLNNEDSKDFVIK